MSTCEELREILEYSRFELENIQEQVKYYEQAVKSDPNDPVALAVLAEKYFEIGDYDEFSHQAAIALRYFPDDSKAAGRLNFLRVHCLIYLQKWKRAKSLVKRRAEQKWSEDVLKGIAYEKAL